MVPGGGGAPSEEPDPTKPPALLQMTEPLDAAPLDPADPDPDELPALPDPAEPLELDELPGSEPPPAVGGGLACDSLQPFMASCSALHGFSFVLHVAAPRQSSRASILLSQSGLSFSICCTASLQSLSHFSGLVESWVQSQGGHSQLVDPAAQAGHEQAQDCDPRPQVAIVTQAALHRSGPFDWSWSLGVPLPGDTDTVPPHAVAAVTSKTP